MFRKKPFICTCGYTIDTCPVLNPDQCPSIRKLFARVEQMKKRTVELQIEKILEEQNFG